MACMQAYDATRVVLPAVDGEPGSDYINASWVDAYGVPNGYIAAQGPVPNSFVDFWRMVWHYEVKTACSPGSGLMSDLPAGYR